MRKFRGMTAESKLRAVKKAISFMCALNVHADEVNDGDNKIDDGGTHISPQINYEQLIAQARKEEKDKLYLRIRKLEEDNAKLVSTSNDNLIKIGDLMQTVSKLKAELEKYESGNGEKPEEVKNLETTIATLTAENERLKRETPNEEEIRKQIEQEYEVKLYLTEQTNANKDEILSSFMPEVQGKTKEEIDESIAKAKEKSLAIKKELGIVDEDGKLIEKKKSSTSKKKTETTPTVPITPKVANPTGDDPNPNYDADYIRNLDSRSDEYKEFRKSLGLK